MAMAVTHKVVFYPVANGDTAQIILENGRRVLLDFNHCANAENETNPAIDLKQRLKDELEEVDRDYFDAVAFTHADNDHIRGSTEFFWLEHAKIYHGDGRIKINELWVPAAMLLEKADRDHQSEEFVLWRQEARHRLLEGTGIRVFSKPEELLDWLHPKLEDRGEATSARDHLFVDAGTIVHGFELGTDGVEFFTHSPFIEHCDGDGDIIRNDAALVFNVRFDADGTTSDYLHFGDTAWEDMELIVQTTKNHGNDDRLRWDLFNIPHHCSYKSLSDEKGKKETEPKPKVKDLLLMGNTDSYMVSSSKPAPDTTAAYDEVQPPHIQARKAYQTHLSEVKGRKFLVTMEQPSTSKPEPMTFEITSGGVGWKETAKKGAAAIITSPAPRAG
jgi:hypothetical protein